MHRDRRLIGACGVLLIGSVGVYFAYSGDRTDGVSREALELLTTIKCSECGEAYQISFEVAEQLAPEAAAEGKPGFRCEKCSRDTAWIKPSIDMSGGLKPPSPSDLAASAEAGLEEVAGVEEKLVPSTTAMWMKTPPSEP